MRVVQVSASRDYDGVQWTRMFSSVDKAWDWVRTVDADQWAGVDDVAVAWVGVDTDSYQQVNNFNVQFDWDTDTATFTKWDADTKQNAPFAV